MLIYYIYFFLWLWDGKVYIKLYLYSRSSIYICIYNDFRFSRVYPSSTPQPHGPMLFFSGGGGATPLLVFHIFFHLLFIVKRVFLRIRFLTDRVLLFLDRVLIFVGLSNLEVRLQNFLGLLDLLFTVWTTLSIFFVLLISVEHLIFLLVALSFEVTTQVDFGTLSSDLERVGLGHIHVASDSFAIVFLTHNGQSNFVLALHFDGETSTLSLD